MHKAALYQRSNGLQRRDAKEVLDEFANNFNFRSDGTDTLMDIGCGSGDVTIDFILPLLPLNFKRLVGSDLSDQMVRYAQESFRHPKIAFQKLDIGGDLTGYLETVEPFDHITSFYCLHWVQNQKKAMQNIFDLLQPDGDCLVAFLAANPIFEIYKQMSQTIKWSHYMDDVNRYISPYQYSINPIKELEKTLVSVGFSDYQVAARDKMFIFDGLDILKKSVRAVNPFLDRIPAEEHEDFLNDYVNIVSSMQLTEIDREKDDCRFLTPYKLLIAYARK